MCRNYFLKTIRVAMKQHNENESQKREENNSDVVLSKNERVLKGHNESKCSSNQDNYRKFSKPFGKFYSVFNNFLYARLLE